MGQVVRFVGIAAQGLKTNFWGLGCPYYCGSFPASSFDWHSYLADLPLDFSDRALVFSSNQAVLGFVDSQSTFGWLSS